MPRWVYTYTYTYTYTGPSTDTCLPQVHWTHTGAAWERSRTESANAANLLLYKSIRDFVSTFFCVLAFLPGGYPAFGPTRGLHLLLLTAYFLRLSGSRERAFVFLIGFVAMVLLVHHHATLIYLLHIFTYLLKGRRFTAYLFLLLSIRF